MFKQLVFFELYTKLAYIPKDRALSKQSRSGEIPSTLNKHFPTLIFFFFFSVGNIQHRQHKFLPSRRCPLTDRVYQLKAPGRPMPCVGLTRARGRFLQRRARRWARSSTQRAASPSAPHRDHFGLQTRLEAPLWFCSRGDHQANALGLRQPTLAPAFPLVSAGCVSLVGQLLSPPPPLHPHSPLSSGA